MQEKFKTIFFIIFILNSFFSSIELSSIEEKKSIIFIKNIDNKDNKTTNKIILLLTYLSNIAEEKILEKYKNTEIKNISENINTQNMQEIINYVFSNGINGFFYLSVDNSNDKILIKAPLYNSIGEKIFENKFFLLNSSNKDSFIPKEKEEEWLKLIFESINKFLAIKEKKVIKKKEKIIYDRDFPLVCIGISAISTKIYFDERMNVRFSKIFSLSPLDIRLCFFPVRYMEVGAFIRFDFNNMAFTYYDKNIEKFKYFDPNFLIDYGVFLGYSYFKKDIHYSIGIQVYNLYYNIPPHINWIKTNNINSYFLPQFSIYQKFDFKLFKYFYFTLFFNLKTLSRFELDGNFLYSKPFLYEFFFIEFSFVGVSLII